MPVSYQQRQSAGPSRKRSYDHITKSEDSSTSPEPPSKRRRTYAAPVTQTSSSSASSPSPSRISRYIGDGLDYRRPRMSSHNPPRSQRQDTIDLTVDDDTPPPAVHPYASTTSISLPRSRHDQLLRAPPFAGRATEPEVIDLSIFDDDNDAAAPAGDPVSAPDSPELQFMGARARTPPQSAVERHPSRRLPLPVPSLGTFADILRGATQTMLGTIRYDRDHDDLTRLSGPPHLGQRMTFDPAANLAIYEDVDLDYGLAGFALGIPDEPPRNTPDRNYKAPAAAKEGFTRTYDEDDMLVCGFCGDELAVGDDEVKAQVWVIKQCGHAYCGACAQNRIIGKGNSRDKKKAIAKMGLPFRYCTAPNCEKAVDSKTKMFQIYL